MLLSFSVSNFKSFRDEQVLDLKADAIKPAFSWLENAAVAVGKEDKALRVKALYGANASGKSNLIKALRVMLSISLTGGPKPGALAELEGFAFDPELRHSPSTFELEFTTDQRRYRYGFRADMACFQEEWLYDETVRKAKVFVRNGQTVSIGKKFFEHPETVAILERGDNSLFRQETSFLSALSFFDVGAAIRHTVQFLSGITVINNTEEVHVEQSAYQFLVGEPMQRKVRGLLDYAGIRFDDLMVMDKEDPKFSKPELLERTRGRYSLMTAYKTGVNEGTDFAWLAEQGESQGTQKLLTLAPYVVRAIEQGSVLFIDEFEAKLHTRLSREIVAMFNSSAGNPNNAQFIFSTHDTNLLDHRLLRRDQIDFVDKGADRASMLYSLSDVKGIRKDADFERDYLGGSYGAVPEVTDFNIAILED
ncbi:ATP-binding protein [Neolewinella lacunae]|uniref:ATP-binding protein n=2 Tax=Neolewinella lacunae TaxID=1517758 RepID=A0A923PNS5_9BACT|nr:ATP-binding protein [Neolewinella lacunae]MBC6996111.1 ATP-binding protein [Neolewinella lacunae]MDN3633965.1 ATP-binding protein [Neolewinella lacunae]